MPLHANTSKYAANNSEVKCKYQLPWSGEAGSNERQVGRDHLVRLPVLPLQRQHVHVE